ncbi:hypothetical protein [Macrococcoides caseolyticum]|uniref:Uncharacterized protein n=1 Tax=Macrococcoides caseolyticum TaxID=69966 RepID=A0A855GF26_9STAP|nr:hypothetical protein [Macrococcus caseolyticus]ARQ03663.1 hypothetical protein CA207_03920 [Macrococcus caseolyticus]PKE05809.1 hypothetical protein CW692_11580 [Macrococcus caseolyticus]PKE21542.1 hypothetical protein CW688_06945 [Macrococcus caseolyticus]PKE22989.1 hypothetical protein CW689_11570 [Macrococcus caseolyticus]PKE25871.1 hypothetical protein CW686_08060 [Macrococcus caseolyticus]
MKNKTTIYVMFMMLLIAAINLGLSYHYIFNVKGLMWMGFVSLFAALLLMMFTVQYYKHQKKQDHSNINAHIKSEDDRILK